MTRDEVQATIDKMRRTASERRVEAMKQQERSDRMSLRREADGLVEAAEMLAEALEKSEATPDRGTLINEAASAGAALVEARERLDRTPREKVAERLRAAEAHADAVARKFRADAALAKVSP